MTNEQLLRDLEAELATGYPDPPSVRHARLLRLDDGLRPADERWNSTNAMAWVFSLRGRVCDLSADRLDEIARWVPRTKEIRDAERQINRRAVRSYQEAA